MMKKLGVMAVMMLAGAMQAQRQQPEMAPGEMAPMEDVVKMVAAKSSLDSEGGAPFHMKATILDAKSHDAQWDATVEEWWKAPGEWRREFHSANFSQTIVVSGGKTEEKDTGAAFPELLRNLTVELVNTVPRIDELAALHQQLMKPDGKKGQIRARYVVTGSDGTVSHDIQCSLAIDRVTGLFTYGGHIDWDVSLHDFADFHGKQIARRLTAQAQGGPTLTAQMSVLEDLSAADAATIKVKHATKKKNQLRVEVVPELTMRKLAVKSPTPVWPMLSELPKPANARTPAKASGSMTMRLVVRRDGTVDSADLYFSDNMGLQKWAEETAMQWKFKPYKDADGPVQVITTLTFPFELK